MPRITADEARAMGEKTFAQLLEQAWGRIRDAAPHSTTVRLRKEDDPVWVTGHKESREKLVEVAEALRADGFRVEYFWDASLPSDCGTTIRWGSR
jgi:hypothetical protein